LRYYCILTYSEQDKGQWRISASDNCACGQTHCAVMGIDHTYLSPS